jgi:predicted ATP-dependent endonuclease of OLD family
MKIYKIEVENYRLLKNFSIDLEDELSLVIGKNNTAKTSLLSVMDKFLNKPESNRFSFEDFNLDFQKDLEKKISDSRLILEDEYSPIGIKMRIFIDYCKEDNLSNISSLMMDLDPDNNVIVIGFDYLLSYEKYINFRLNYQEYYQKESKKKKKASINKFTQFCKENHSEYFHSNKKSFEFDKLKKDYIPNKFIDLDKEKLGISDIINFKYISARRDVTNKDLDKTLSGQTSKIYNKSEANEEKNKAIEKFKERLRDTDTEFSKFYETIFNETLQKLKEFGGLTKNETQIEIKSTLQHRELLQGNTTVLYKHDENNHLPEHYNGLGYMNLISMILEIEILLHEFKREKEKFPADINLLFIEEPEAHTHPQMQYIFIKNIKKLLKEGIVPNNGVKRKLQYILSTHSAHIVADSDFEDIKYLKRISTNSVIAKNLKDLEKEYIDNGREENFRFLKQYLTLHRAELFFADKAIFLEGDTERILLPAMMKKLDKDNSDNPLHSQNISIVEVGNYTNIFEKFINFLGIKSLIITDLDSVKKDFVKHNDGSEKKTRKGTPRTVDIACKVSEGETTTNPSLKYFFNKPKISDLISLSLDNKRFIKRDSQWINSKEGFLQIIYQTEEESYTARSFEDAFFSLKKNIQFIKSNRAKFRGLKNKKYFYDVSKSPYDLAELCIGSKGTFALDILVNSSEYYENWEIPAYIKEGLLWLQTDQI